MLLKNSGLKISEVATSVNLEAQAYFYTVFKEKYGIAPLQYRKAVRHT